jgi:ribonuclease HI
VKKIEIYTDGACSGNPGPGGWGAVLIYNGAKKEISGFCEDTTNNRMEIFAAINALKTLKEPCAVDLYSDSAYTVDAFNKNWIDYWQKNNWRTTSKQEVKNQDLWRELLGCAAIHKIKWFKVKGHSDNELNNRCDFLATEQIKNNAGNATTENNKTAK